MSAFIVTGLKGFEPLMTESESVALPLGDSPSTTIRSIAQTDKIFKYFLKFFYFLRLPQFGVVLSRLKLYKGIESIIYFWYTMYCKKITLL